MSSMQFDVLGIGNAIVDVIARTDEAFLADRNAQRYDAADRSGASRASVRRHGAGGGVSGGSAANTIVGVASLGARAAFIGKVKDDELGRVFAHDIRAAGVAFSTPPASAAPRRRVATCWSRRTASAR